MILRNSILSIFRSKWKTALFTLLIFAVTLVYSLSVSVWAAVAQFLQECDNFYTSIAQIEYMGTNYPNDTIYDASMNEALSSFNTAMIENDPAAQSWETPSRSFGYIEGFWRTDSYMPDKMLSVLVIGNVVYEEERNFYKGVVYQILYSSLIEDEIYIFIDEDFGKFEKGHYYLIFGQVYRGYSPILHLRPATFDNAISATDGIEVPQMVDITSDGSNGQYYQIPEDSILLQVAETLPVTNNSLLVSGTDNLLAMLPFQQGELYVVDGRAFNEKEYQQGSRVIIISEIMAARLGIGVGDSIELSIAVSNLPGIYNSYWFPHGFSKTSTFQVVGIVNTLKDRSWYVYIPRSVGVPSSEFPIGYTVGHAVIRNEDAAAFYERLESAMKNRFQLTIYDQGYASVSQPYQTILIAAKIVTAVCSLVELAVLTFFGYLFVYRQRETSETMLMLGTSKLGVCAYFLISSGCISLFAAASGAFAGYHLHEKILRLVADFAEKYTLIDSRFSNGNLTITRVLAFSPDLNWQLFLYIGIIVFILAITACMVFTISTLTHNQLNRPPQWGPNKEGKTSHLSGGSVKFSILSMLRGGLRTIIVPLLSVVVVIFFGQLASNSLHYQEQLDVIYDNTTIEGYYTDIHGKQIGNLVLNTYDVAQLYRTGYLNTLTVSISNPYYYLGVSRLADGTERDIDPLYVPSSSFSRESLEAVIERGADLTGTNNIRKSPEYYYADTISMDFLKGFDEKILAVPFDEQKVFNCILPIDFMQQQGIELGDTVRIAINRIITDAETQARIYLHIDLHVVGSYEKHGTENTIYVPLSLFINTQIVWGEGQTLSGAPIETFKTGFVFSTKDKNILQRTTLHSSTFALTDSRDLSDFKDYLTEYGYSQVNKVSRVREFLILNDKSFNYAVASIQQQIRYINILYPFLYILVGIIAVTVSYLVVVSRKNEFAIMRGLGARRLHVFFSFFFEQCVLSILGTAIGSCLWRFVFGAPTLLHYLLIAGFLICYFLGCIISIMIMNHTNVLKILLDRD